MGSSGNQSSPRTARRGSHFTDRQIAQSVRDGRVVEIHTVVSSQSGWIFGADDFHWGIVDRMGSTCMVHKTAPSLRVTDITLEMQPQDVRDLVEPIVKSYRESIMREHFGAKTS